MFKLIIDKYEEWKFNHEFEKKKKELLEKDPFIYDLSNNDKKN